MINSVDALSIYFPHIGTETNIRTPKWQSLQPLLWSVSREQGPGECLKNAAKGERTIKMRKVNEPYQYLENSQFHLLAIVQLSSPRLYSDHFEFRYFKIFLTLSFV